jgi:hypothetical protein
MICVAFTVQMSGIVDSPDAQLVKDQIMASLPMEMAELHTRVVSVERAHLLMMGLATEGRLAVTFTLSLIRRVSSNLCYMMIRCVSSPHPLVVILNVPSLNNLV